VALVTSSQPLTSFDMLWSVAVEEQVYLVLPFVVLIVSPRRLPWVFGAVIVLALVWRLLLT
jgi:peptidoglycan/LPS O-acetylase OafA/YrhL